GDHAAAPGLNRPGAAGVDRLLASGDVGRPRRPGDLQLPAVDGRDHRGPARLLQPVEVVRGERGQCEPRHRSGDGMKPHIGAESVAPPTSTGVTLTVTHASLAIGDETVARVTVLDAFGDPVVG